MMAKLLAHLSQENHAVASQIAALSQSIGDFGHLKEHNLKAAHEAEAALWGRMGALN
jgi:hypothetical protein